LTGDRVGIGLCISSGLMGSGSAGIFNDRLACLEGRLCGSRGFLAIRM